MGQFSPSPRTGAGRERPRGSPARLRVRGAAPLAAADAARGARRLRAAALDALPRSGRGPENDGARTGGATAQGEEVGKFVVLRKNHDVFGLWFLFLVCFFSLSLFLSFSLSLFLSFSLSLFLSFVISFFLSLFLSLSFQPTKWNNAENHEWLTVDSPTASPFDGCAS